ncbi:phage/plasmid primase, P4 family [Streptomyces sp. NPDC001507]|uniref:DNA primase family protein n=1 Tax=Streptomyces sp. NPDC001507 TaxID=3364579 RepID=UPI0036865C6D
MSTPQTFTLEQLQDIFSQLTGSTPTEDVGMHADDDLAEYAWKNAFGGNVVFNRALGWRYYRPGDAVWTVDPRGDKVASEVQSMMRDLRSNEKDQRRSQILGSKTKRDAVVAMLAGLPEVATTETHGWDEHPDLVAAPNGVIELRTGELLPGDPALRLTKAVRVPYDADAECPRWERFISEVFAHDPELPGYVQRLLGYGLTGHVKEQCFAVLFGPSGANGKSTLLTALRNIAGPHAATVPFDMFTKTGKGRSGPDAELLLGARLALASETNRTAELDTAAIKNATGGEEINVNPKYRDPFAFKPEALILLATNYKPVVRDMDGGTWRRIKVLPFLQRFEGDNKDPHLEDTLREEYPGILAWLVRGAAAWYADGLNEPASVTEAIAEYREESDPVAEFIADVITVDPVATTRTSMIWAAYMQWAEDEGKHATFKDSGTLVRALTERLGDAVTPVNERRYDGDRGDQLGKKGRGLRGVRVAARAA